jgi:hypothetical protein
MNLKNIKNMDFTDYYIAAKELKKFRRVYFTSDQIYVMKAPNDRIKIYFTVGIVALFLFLSAFFNQSVIISGLLWGVILTALCGSISGIFIIILFITIRLWSFDNKLKNSNPSEILNLDKDNYTINYNDIKNIEFNPLPKSFFKKEGELLIGTTHNLYKLTISDEHFEEIKDKIKKIESQMPEKKRGGKSQ